MPKDNQATVHLSLQEFLKSIVDDEDFSIAFRSAAVQELDRISKIEIINAND